MPRPDSLGICRIRFPSSIKVCYSMSGWGRFARRANHIARIQRVRVTLRPQIRRRAKNGDLHPMLWLQYQKENIRGWVSKRVSVDVGFKWPGTATGGAFYLRGLRGLPDALHTHLCCPRERLSLSSPRSVPFLRLGCVFCAIKSRHHTMLRHAVHDRILKSMHRTLLRHTVQDSIVHNRFRPVDISADVLQLVQHRPRAQITLQVSPRPCSCCLRSARLSR